ncbi:MAG: glycosyltransferase [Planctomycetota bacterium]
MPPRDVPLLIQTLRRLAADPELRRRLGQTGRSHCREQFDHRRMVARIEQLYQRVL